MTPRPTLSLLTLNAPIKMLGAALEGISLVGLWLCGRSLSWESIAERIAESIAARESIFFRHIY